MNLATLMGNYIRKRYMRLTHQKLTILHESLLFLHIGELRNLCTQLELPHIGKKLLLIQRIVRFLSTGEILKNLTVPPVSCAQKKSPDPITPHSLILKGSYKNNLETRNFFKSLIGDHFHFTAFGIDWINERWLEGNPPTYQEYATMWQDEYTQRKLYGSTPKEEWGYINFIQSYTKNLAQASREEGLAAWEDERRKHVTIVEELLNKKVS